MQSGTAIGDRFTLQRLAGAGGMGSVYRAEDQITGRPVAIKVLRSDGPADEARFLREASVLASLSYPAIVGCLGHGLLPSGEPWLAMEWIEGESLASKLERGPLSPFDAIALARAIAGALAAAHERGIIHRDVKPGNILLEGGDPERARLIDFGLARIHNAHQATLSGALLGTPAYMAPEQIRAAHEVDGRADLYALGAILFECLTGRRPFISHDNVLGLITQALFEPAPHIRDLDPQLPKSLESLVDSLLEKEPVKRLGPASKVLEALASVELDEALSRAAPSLPRLQGLTREEVRFVSVVLVASAPLGIASELAETLITRSEGSLLQAMERMAAPLSGRVEGLRDGTVLIAFAGGGAATDQAATAARMALGIRDLASDLPIAVATGRANAACGSLYSDAAVRAASLVKHIASGEATVVLDETTRGLLDARFSVERQNDTFFLLAEDPLGEPGRLLCGRPAPFVGREREVVFVEKVFDDVVNEPSAAAVIIVGEAGSGKSRLGREVLAALSRISPNTEIWVGRAEAVQAGSSFGVLANALQQAANICEGEPFEMRSSRFSDFVTSHVKAQSAPPILTFLGEIAELRVPDAQASPELRAARRDPVFMGDRIRLAWEDLVEATTRERPLVLLLEDLHWGDLPTVKLLDASLRSLHRRPFLIIALGRPEMLEVFPGLFAERAPHTVRLSGLSRRACQTMIRRVLGEGVSEDAAASLVERSAGHPLFLEELLRTMLEASSKGALALPETVLAMVQSRVEKLQPEARRVLRAASVFGETCWRGGIAKLLGPGEAMEGLDGWLGLLCDREILEEKRSSRFPSEREYFFRHALFREAAYSMLTEEDRTVGHSLAGSFLEDLGEKNAALLAAHFDAAKEPEKASLYHLRAAREALGGSDFDAVLRHADRVQAGGAKGVVLGEALALRGDALQWRSAFEAASEAAEAALPHLEEGSPTWFAALTTLAIAAGRRIQSERLEALGETLVEWGKTNTWTEGYLEASVKTAFQAHIGGQYRVAETLMLPLISLLEGEKGQTQGPRIKALLQLVRASRHSVGWRYDLTISGYLESAASYEAVGDLRSAASQRLDACFFLLDLGQPEKAEELCRDIIAIADRLSLLRLRSSAQMTLGAALVLLGQLDEALSVLLAAKDDLDAFGDARLGASVRTRLGRCYRARKQYAEAEQMLDEARQMLTTLPRHQLICLSRLALVYLDLARPAEALEVASLAMQLMAQLKRIGTDEILVRYVYVKSLLHTGKLEEARIELSLAKERFFWMRDRLSDEAFRCSFTERVEECRELLALEIPGETSSS